MTRDETVALLEMCAAYDGRQFGPGDADAWAEGLTSPWVPGMSLDEAQSAVVAHYRVTSQRIGVADVLKAVQQARVHEVPQSFPLRPQGVPPNEEYRQARAALEARLAARNRGEAS